MKFKIFLFLFIDRAISMWCLRNKKTGDL